MYNHTILAIDDEPEFLKILIKSLSSKYRVLTAESGEEGLKVLSGNSVNCVLLDILMPGKSGIDVLKYIRYSYPDMPVIIISGYGKSQVIDQAIDFGAVGFMDKPISLHALHAEIEKAIVIANKNEIGDLPVEILLVDNDLERSETFAVNLKQLSHKVHRADSAKKAMEIIKGQKIDIVIVGLTIATNNELQFMEDITKIQGAITPVILMDSTKADYHIVLEAIKKGAICSINKPITFQDIRLAIELGINSLKIVYALNVKNSELSRKGDLLDKAYQQLKRSHVQLIQAEKMASIGQLAAGIAHEINNPLGFISENMQNLKKFTRKLVALTESFNSFELSVNKKAEFEAEKENINYNYIKSRVEKIIECSIEGINRIKDIVQDLKSFSRIDTAEIDKINLHDTIDTTLCLLSNEYKNRIEIIKNYGHIPPICCYSGKINQVIMNILLNAFQSIEGEGKIRIKTDTEDKMVKIAISDSGRGIAGEIKSKIFDPFFTTKPVGSGTGLGLSVSHEIVKQHGGSLSVFSEEGKGSTFTIKIPVNPNHKMSNM